MSRSLLDAWPLEADAALAELKALLSTQPALAAPISKEPLLLYIAATGQVVSIVLTVEREEQKHLPIEENMTSSSILHFWRSWGESYSVFSFPNEDSTPTQKKLALYSE